MNAQKIRLVIPTGRLNEPVLRLLAESGLDIPRTTKNYRPLAADPRFEVKLLKAANIPTLLELGAHDIGFSGRDWVEGGLARRPRSFFGGWPVFIPFGRNKSQSNSFLASSTPSANPV